MVAPVGSPHRKALVPIFMDILNWINQVISDF